LRHERCDRSREARAEKIADAGARAEAGRWTEAMEMLQGLASANPGQRDILEKLLEITDGFRSAILQHNFTLDDIPVVTIGPDAISQTHIEPAEAFIMSRIDGRLTVREIIRISTLSEFECLRTMKRLLSAKVIDFPSRSSPKEQTQPRLRIAATETVP